MPSKTGSCTKRSRIMSDRCDDRAIAIVDLLDTTCARGTHRHTVPLAAIGLFSVPLASTVFYSSCDQCLFCRGGTPYSFWHLDREIILGDPCGSRRISQIFPR